MARVTCRCGETFKVKSTDPDRIVCSRCGAKIRVRRDPTAAPGLPGAGDGYIRFNCPCGRRLKVQAQDRPEAGKCPDCGRVVPVPDSAWEQEQVGASPQGPGDSLRPGRSPNARTEDLDAADLARLEAWASRHLGRPLPAESPGQAGTTTSHEALGALASSPSSQPEGPPDAIKMEAGLRVCPRCGKPVHMSATVCRNCGEPVPKR
jgi:ribosomal protein L32